MLAFFFMFAILLSLANALDDVERDNDNNDEAGGYSNSSSCISKYRDLESYVLNNEDLMDELTELFFKTGKSSTEFVKITYKFQILLPVNNNTNITNGVRYYDDDDDNGDGEFTCIHNQKNFIWSSSALYLLGPKPLFWQTLFAVHVMESSITIHLPCLCSDVYDLLSRLTYLVSEIYI